MAQIIDTHAHYNVRQYNKDRTALLNKLFNEKDIELIINCGTNTKTNKEVIKLASQFPGCKAVIGYFPCDVMELVNDTTLLEKLEKQLQLDEVIGLGEIGLDYHWNTPNAKIQREWFAKQLRLADRTGTPVCIHSRDAEADTLEILKANPIKSNKIMHSFSYGPAAAAQLCKMDFYFGIGGMATYKGNHITEALQEVIPLTKVLLETDAPYLTPYPNRRDRNSSDQLIHVAEYLSKIYGTPVETIIEITNKNAKEAYGLS